MGALLAALKTVTNGAGNTIKDISGIFSLIQMR